MIDFLIYSVAEPGYRPSRNTDRCTIEVPFRCIFGDLRSAAHDCTVDLITICEKISSGGETNGIVTEEAKFQGTKCTYVIGTEWPAERWRGLLRRVACPPAPTPSPIRRSAPACSSRPGS